MSATDFDRIVALMALAVALVAAVGYSRAFRVVSRSRTIPAGPRATLRWQVLAMAVWTLVPLVVFVATIALSRDVPDVERPPWNAILTFFSLLTLGFIAVTSIVRRVSIFPKITSTGSATQGRAAQAAGGVLILLLAYITGRLLL